MLTLRTQLQARPGLRVRSRAKAVALALLLLALPSVAPLPTGASATGGAEPMRFGMDLASIDPQTNAGVRPDYGLFWIGPWTLQSGWGGPDNQLDRAYTTGVTPVIQFYYWGDDISQACLESGCWSSLHNAWKSQANWTLLAQQLVAHLDSRMHGREAVIILETEFNKGNVATYEPLDGYLQAKAQYFRANYPAAQLVLGFGNWAPQYWGTWDRAMGAVDLAGIQAMRGSTRNSLSSYYTLVNGTISGAQTLKDLFGKGVLVDDVALSSYAEPAYLGHQANVTRGVFQRLPDLKAAGVQGIVYRSFKDSPNADLANYYGEAERHWGMAWPNGTWKPSFTAWRDGVLAERGTPTGPPAVSVGTSGVAAVEAEAFASRPGGVRLSDGAASGGAAWDLARDATISQPFDFAAAGVYEVRVRVRGVPLAGVAPHLEVALGGALVRGADPGTSFTVASAWVQVAEPGARDLALRLTNAAASEGRHLVLDKAELEWLGTLPPASSGDTTRVEVEDFSDRAAGPLVRDRAASGGLAVRLAQDAAVRHELAVPEGRYQLRAVARGEPQAGVLPALALSLDGNLLGVRTVGAGGYQVLYADTADLLGPGPHHLSLALVNDVPPAGGEDLAVRLDRVALERLAPLVNHPPVASFDWNAAGLHLGVDASPSSDPDGDPLSFGWDFGDGSAASGKLAGRAFEAPGTYAVRLLASDAFLDDAALRNVSLVAPNHAPDPNFWLSSDGRTLTVDAGLSTDPDGDALSFTWTWGDGAQGSGARAAHTYAANGTYTVTLRASDGELRNSTARDVVVRSPAAPAPARAVLQRGLLASAPPASSGEPVVLSFTLRNDGGLPIVLGGLGVGVGASKLQSGPVVLLPGMNTVFSAGLALKPGPHTAVAFVVGPGGGPSNATPGDAGTSATVTFTVPP